MSTVPSPETSAPDALDVLLREIDASKQEHRATSRHRLAEMIAKETGLTYREALAEVEAYCDAKEPAIPEYLSSEFGIFWLKVLAVVNASVGIVVFSNGLGMYRSNRPAWPLWALGTVFIGIAVFLWVRSLEAESDRRQKA